MIATTDLPKGMTLVQIGVTAMRGPDGKPLPGVPMYIIVPKAKDAVPAGREALDTVSGLFAEKFREYREGTKNLPD